MRGITFAPRQRPVLNVMDRQSSDDDERHPYQCEPRHRIAYDQQEDERDTDGASDVPTARHRADQPAGAHREHVERSRAPPRPDRDQRRRE